MAADFYLKKGDTLPRLTARLTRADGTAINLSTASVLFKMRKVGSATTKVSSAADIITAAEGRVEYAWQPEDTAEAGQFEAEWVVATGEAVQRIPNSGFFYITILDVIA